MTTQAEKGAAFHALHRRAGAFLIPNPWDMGSARVLAHLGFEALATTSSGFAFTLGKPDGAVSRAAMLAHVAAMVSAVDLPVSADLENGYGDSPECVAETIALAAAAGVVGCSIEDATARPVDPIYSFDQSLRIRENVVMLHDQDRNTKEEPEGDIGILCVLAVLPQEERES